MKKKTIAIIVVLLCVAALILWRVQSNQTTPDSVQQNTSNSTQQPDNAGDKNIEPEHSLAEPGSIWVVVNKLRPLSPKSYKPNDLVVPNVPLRVPGNETMQLREITANAVESMFAAAKQEGIDMMVASGFRSYEYQTSLYNGYVQSQGQTVADTQSARPGYSEHQTGLAFDITNTDRSCELEACFGDTVAGKWAAANAYKYGFIMRYPENKTDITGYTYEPWHFRFVGIDLSTSMHNKNVETLEEYFALPAAPSY